MADFTNLDTLDLAIQARACHLINITLDGYQASQEPTKKKDNELFQQAKLEMVKAHMKCLQMRMSRSMIDQYKGSDAKVKYYLELVQKIFALDQLIEDGAAAFDCGFFAPGSLNAMRQAMDELVRELRPQLIPLIECLHMPDHWKPSTIGNSYGDIYEWQLAEAKESRLNKHKVVPYFDELIKPVLKGKL